jgi:hypothetical protein
MSTNLSGTHDYDAGSGTWKTKTPTVSPVRTAQDISNLAGGYNFDEAKIRSLFDEATKREYAAKKASNQVAQNQYAKNVGGYINTLSDTMRQSLNKAVATGGSRGLVAAEAMIAAQDATRQTSEDANNLALERMQLDYDEAEAYAKNAKDAEALVHTRKSGALDQSIQLDSIDAQRYASEMGAMGQYYYGGDSARVNYAGNVLNDETERRGQDITANTNKTSQLLGILQSNNMTAEGRAALEEILGLPPGSLQNAPTPTYNSGGYYNNNNGGSYNNNSDPTKDNTTGNPYLDYAEAAAADKQQQTDALNTYLTQGDKAKWVALYMQLNEGVSEGKAESEYDKQRRLYTNSTAGVSTTGTATAGGYTNLPGLYVPGSPIYGK